MLINIVSNLGQETPPEKLYNFNQVVAWSLRKAFEKRGIETRFVQDRLMEKGGIPQADHCIVISAKAMVMIRASGQSQKLCYERLRKATTGKMTLYLDSDFGRWGKIFDCVFTLAKPQRLRPSYFYAGWGANPEFCYPEQRERSVYLDSLKIPYHNGKFDDIFDILRDVLKISEHSLETTKSITQTLPNLNMTLYMPVPRYNKRFKTIYWPEIQEILRKCHYYCCTQLGEGGLTRIEAATCGALLVVPKALYRPKTMETLEHKIWETKDELLDILSTKTDVNAIRKKALEHSWDKVVDRMLKVLEDKPN